MGAVEGDHTQAPGDSTRNHGYLSDKSGGGQIVHGSSTTMSWGNNSKRRSPARGRLRSPFQSLLWQNLVFCLVGIRSKLKTHSAKVEALLSRK